MVQRQRGPLKTRRPPLPLVLGLVCLVAFGAWVLGAYDDFTDEPVVEIDESPAQINPRPVLDLSSLMEPSEQINAARGFWSALGAGDTAAALSYLDPDGGAALTHMTSFAAAFRAGFEPSGCELIIANGVRCTVSAGNSDLIALYYSQPEADEYSTVATVIFADEGVNGFDLPGLLLSGSARLAKFAGEETGVPSACKPINYNRADLPNADASLAQTAGCARALADLIPGALEAIE